MSMIDMLKQGPLKDSGIFEHICELIRNQTSDKNQLKNLSEIELLSFFIRTHKFKFQELLEDHTLKQKISKKKQYSQYVEKLSKIIADAAKIENNKVYIQPDLQSEYQALKTAGISIGQNNYFYLGKVIRTLAIKNSVKEIRFWGKILGKQDYYVIQGVCAKPYLSDDSPDIEPYGTGVNSYSYWVATDILGEWTELPLVVPEQVKASRNLKYIFSGNLEQDVHKLAKFPGKEKHLLKCVIARITHGCQLVPKGLYKLSQNDPNILEFQQQFKLPEVAEMATLDNWVHLAPHIMNEGRTTHFIDPSLNQQQKDARKAQLQEKQPPTERLRGITEEKPAEIPGMFQYPANWTVKICGETIPVGLIGREEGQSVVYGVALLRNISWPGASTVCYRGGWTNIYIGYGHRETQENKIMQSLPDFEGEGMDVNQVSEPNPSKAPEPEQPKPEEGGEEPPAD